MTDKKINRVPRHNPLNRDYFEFWMEEAFFHANNAALPKELVVETLSILQSTFGKDWLLEECKKSKPPVSLPRSIVHPAASWVATPCAMGVFEAMELASYLKRLYAKPKFPDVVRFLKNKNQFEGARLQLAFGARFLRAGVTDLEFEPSSDGGRQADLLFKFNSQPYLVECYVPDPYQHYGYFDLMQTTAPKLLDVAKHFKKRILLFFWLNEDIDASPDVRKEIEKICVHRIETLAGQTVRFAIPHGEVEILDLTELTSEQRQSRWDEYSPHSICGLNTALTPRDQLSHLMRGESVQEREFLSSVMLKVDLPEDPLIEIIDKLAAKIEKKVTQLRKAGVAARGIFLVDTHHAHPRNMEEKNIQLWSKRIYQKMQQHKNVFGVFLLDRVWQSPGRHRYNGVFVDCRDDENVTCLLNKLVDLEQNGDILSET